jgi:hypothetical protein
MPPSFTNILLHQNRGSMHNKDCTCEFNSWGGLKQANPACPVQGHRYSLCLHVSLWPSTPSLYASPAQRGRGVEQLPVKLTFETMAAVRSTASISTRQIHRSSSVGRMTRRSAYGMLTVARRSRSLRATGNRILRKVASLAWGGSTPPPLTGGEA